MCDQIRLPFATNMETVKLKQAEVVKDWWPEVDNFSCSAALSAILTASINIYTEYDCCLVKQISRKL